MQINLPIILKVEDYHEFKKQKNLLNQVLKLESNELHLGEAVDFVEIGFNKFNYAYFFDNNFKIDNNDIIKCFLKHENKVFKDEKSILNYLEDIIQPRILDNINLKFIIEELSKEQPILVSKQKKKTI